MGIEQAQQVHSSELKILFKFTTRSRPELFLRGMNSIIDNCTNENYQILVSVDKDDTSMATMEQNFWGNSKVVFCYGHSTGKINAINRDLNVIDKWDILVNMSDDMVFNTKGFDVIIRESFAAFEGGYELDRCIHFPDGNTTELITMSILGRKYFDRFGYIYHPDYISLFCDNEQTDVAKLLGKYCYTPIMIFEHLHPAFGKAQSDQQYDHTESFWHQDEATYKLRRSMNFGI